MNLSPRTRRARLVMALALALATLLPGAAYAHRAWLLPSATVRSGPESEDACGALICAEVPKGEVTVRWPALGMYWMSASSPHGDGQQAGTLQSPARRASCAVTLEVLAQ